jgi:predicted kinase
LPPPFTLFLISPANLGGQRGALLFNPGARFPLAEQLRTPEGAPLGDVFSFVSGLYFRGKRAYAEAFGKAPDGLSAGLVISPAEGLRFLYEPVTLERLRGWAHVPIDARNPAFTEPLIEHVRGLDRALGASAQFVLLGSVATDKYVEPLGGVLGPRLLFPPEFLGRGDMSRGSLLLRAARSGVELSYAPIEGSARHGPRPIGRVPRRHVDAPGLSRAEDGPGDDTEGSRAPGPQISKIDGVSAMAPREAAGLPDVGDSAAAPELVILVGLPGSGKSTFYAQRFAASHALVSRDVLRRSGQSERRQDELIHRALRDGKSVVVDNTHVTEKDRAALIALGRSRGARITVYLFDSTARECVARNRGREGVARVPPIAIFAGARRLVRPHYGEGFDQLFLVRPLAAHGFDVTLVEPAASP